jgi:hypothetical protein
MRSFITISPNVVTYATTLRASFLILTVLAGAAVALPGLSAIAAPLHQSAWIIPAPKEGPRVVETRFRGGPCGRPRRRRLAWRRRGGSPGRRLGL